MDYEREYTLAALAAVADHLPCLPDMVRRKVRLAQSILETRGSVTSEELEAEIGSRNWVIAQRTRRIVEKYGDNVICLTPKRYNEAYRRALEKRIPA